MTILPDFLVVGHSSAVTVETHDAFLTIVAMPGTHTKSIMMFTADCFTSGAIL